MWYDITNYVYMGTLVLGLIASVMSFYSAHKLGGELSLLLRFLAIGLLIQSGSVLYLVLAEPFELPKPPMIIAASMLVSSVFYLIAAWKARGLLR